MTDTDMWTEFDSGEANDRDAEAAVLGACLLNPGLLDEITLGRGDFYTPSHAIVWEALQAMHTAGAPVDAITLVGRLADAGALGKVGGGPYVHDLVNAVPAAANGPHYAARVKSMSRRRAVAAFAAAAKHIAAGTDEEAMVAELRSRLDALDDTAPKTGPVPWSQVSLEGMEAIEAAGDGGQERGIPTGLTDLDRVLTGLRPGDVTIIGGRPGSGKSILGAQIAAHAALDLGYPAVLASLEMRRHELYNRIIASRLSITLDKLGKGTLRDDEWSKLARLAGDTADSPLWIEDEPNQTIESIGATARKWKRKHGLRLLVIDYLQLIKPPKAENRQAEVSKISREMKLLASQLEIPVILAAQLNRNPEGRSNKLPALGDLRESGSLEADASNVILVHREAASDPNSVREGEADLIVAKNRHGAQDTVTVASQLHYARFASMAGADRFGVAR